MALPRLLQRLLRRPQPRLPPLDAAQAQRLAHRRRAAERQLRDVEKYLRKVNCGTCVRQEPSRGAIRMEQTATALRREIAAIDQRLAERTG